MVPQAELEVIKRRCCCTGSVEPSGIPCPECPAPISPCLTPRYRISIATGGILPDSAGKGCLAFLTHVFDCMRGACTRTEYRRIALEVDVLALGVCEEADMCRAIKNEAAPTGEGKHILEWQTCAYFIEPGLTPPDPNIITDNQQGDVFINSVYSQIYWDPAVCFWVNAVPPGLPNDCRSVVQVTYNYYDSFTYPQFEDIGGCTELTSTFAVSRTWICWYSRRVQAGQFTAEGTYRLVRCDYPPGISTIPASGSWNPGCTLPGGIVCSADGLTSVGKIPTLWQPPASITVDRLC